MEDLLTGPQAAELCGVTPAAIRKWRQRGQLAPMRPRRARPPPLHPTRRRPGREGHPAASQASPRSARRLSPGGTVTTPYSPETATALAIGATTAGYVEGSGPTWDDDIATYNLREADRRASILALYQRDAIAALHRALLPPTATVRVLCMRRLHHAGHRLHRRRRIPALARLAPRTAPHQHPVHRHRPRRQDDARDDPAILAALPAACPDIVLIAFGTNDAAQPDLTDWAARCGQLVDQILASSPTVRVVVARPALSRAAWLTTGEAAVDAAVDTVVNARKTGGRAASADMTTVPQRWTGDGVHPSTCGYLLMAQRWTDAINPWLPTPA